MSVKSDSPSLPGSCDLAEDDLLLLAVNGAPGADAPLQRATHALVQFGMTTHHLLENGHWPDARCGLQHRHDLRVENVGERVGTPAAARLLLLRGQSWILLDAIGRCRADRRLRRRDGRRMVCRNFM